MAAAEFDFIAALRRRVAGRDDLLVGIGDDLAVLRWPAASLVVVGADQVLAGVHFLPDADPHAIGAKVMNRNLSDCAAMGATPVAAVVTAALPRSAGVFDRALAIHEGILAAGAKHGCLLVGGDTAVWDGPLALSLTVLGRIQGRPLTRSGARPGDGVYVTGPLGGSILGRHLAIVPRIPESQRLVEWGGVSAMIDLSDGLSRDAGHIAAMSDVRIDIDAASVPIHADAHRLAATTGRPAIEHALNDGEDYELLFTSAAVPPLGTRIGTISAGQGVWLRDAAGVSRPIEVRGWEHRAEPTP